MRPVEGRSPRNQAVCTVASLAVALVLVLPLSAAVALADANSKVVQILEGQNVYVSPGAQRSNRIPPSAVKQLNAAIQAGARDGVPEKIAIVTGAPGIYRNAQDAAFALRHYLDFSGIIVLVSSGRLGMSSDLLASREVGDIEAEAGPKCARGYATCALAAARRGALRVASDQSTSQRNSIVLGAVLLPVLLIVLVILLLQARRRTDEGRLNDPRRSPEVGA